MAQVTQTFYSAVRACECTTSLDPVRTCHEPFNVVRVACTYLRPTPELLSLCENYACLVEWPTARRKCGGDWLLYIRIGILSKTVKSLNSIK